MVLKRLPTADSHNMAVRAAWLHYAGGYTQSEVAKKLGVSSLKAHRLINQANKVGMVKVYIDGDLSECVSLENELSSLHNLDYCEVVPDIDEDLLPLKALGVAGAEYLRRVLENPDVPSVGVGHGRTLAACVRHLPKSPAIDKTIVSLLGGFSRKFAANPHDVIHRLAERTGAAAYVMPVPFIANTVKNKAVILEQSGIAEVLDLAKNTTLKIIGIGSVDADASIVANEMVEVAELEAVQKAGAVGELLGHFFDSNGEIVKTDLSDRTMGLSATELTESNFFAVAGGVSKVRAISAILKSRVLHGLITDERTARALVDLGGDT